MEVFKVCSFLIFFANWITLHFWSFHLQRVWNPSEIFDKQLQSDSMVNTPWAGFPLHVIVYIFCFSRIFKGLPESIKSGNKVRERHTRPCIKKSQKVTDNFLAGLLKRRFLRMTITSFDMLCYFFLWLITDIWTSAPRFPSHLQYDN